MSLEKKIKDLLEQNDGLGLVNLLKNIEPRGLRDDLIVATFDHRSILSYAFICMQLIRQESVEWHDLAIELLIHPLCPFEGAYAAASYHVKRAIELNPKDTGFKELLLFLHGVPDQVVGKEEAVAVAQQILEEEPDNKCARNFLEGYGNR